jgi:hypothetical protein
MNNLTTFASSGALMSIIFQLIEQVDFFFIKPNPIAIISPLIASLICLQLIPNTCSKRQVIMATYLCMFIPFAGARFGQPNDSLKTKIKLVAVTTIGSLFYGIIIELWVNQKKNNYLNWKIIKESFPPLRRRCPR